MWQWRGNGVASLACRSPSFILLLGECGDVHRISTFAIYCVRSTHIDAETMCETIFHSIHSFINFIILGLVCTRNAPHSILFRFNSRATGVKISPRYNFIWLQSQTIRGNCFACDSLSSTREITMEKCWWCTATPNKMINRAKRTLCRTIIDIIIVQSIMMCLAKQILFHWVVFRPSASDLICRGIYYIYEPIVGARYENQ